MSKIRVQFSLTGLAHMPRDEVFDTEDLTQGWAQLGIKLFNPTELSRQSKKHQSLPMPDGELWRVTLLDSDSF